LDDTLSAGQVFQVAGRVVNRGTAEVDTTGRVLLRLPAGFALEPATPDSVRNFRIGEDVSWRVRAPSGPVPSAILEVRILRSPVEYNRADSAAVSVRSAGTPVTVEPAAELRAAGLAAVGPPGAVDDTLSTGQDVLLRAVVWAGRTAEGLRARLELPVGYQAFDPNPPLVDLGHGGDDSLAAVFRVKAPLVPGTDSVRVFFEGADENSGDSLRASGTLLLTVLPRAELALHAWIHGPREALDSTLTLGMPFRIAAVVTNAPGHAGVDSSASSPRLSLSVPPGYRLVDASLRPFMPGDTVIWEVEAPDRPTGAGNLSVSIAALPDDENAGVPAYVTPGGRIVAIPVRTEEATLGVRNLSEALGVKIHDVVPEGSRDVAMLALEFTNLSEQADSVGIRWIEFTLLDQDGHAVPHPERTLAALRIRYRGGTVEADRLGTHPIRVTFPGDLILGAGESDTLRVSVDLLETVKVTEFRLDVADTSSIYAVDELSGARLAVVDRISGEAFAGKLRSQPLVVLSGRFETYVHNYPNPFRAGSEPTWIVYDLDRSVPVEIRIYTLTGELVYRESFPAGAPETTPGPHRVPWDGRNLRGELVRNGLYVCEVRAGGRLARFRIAVAK
jgi:hypothetical protein